MRTAARARALARDGVDGGRDLAPAPTGRQRRRVPRPRRRAPALKENDGHHHRHEAQRHRRRRGHGVDVDQLLSDDSLAGTIMDALEENGVLVFRGLHLDPEAQVEWCHKLGEIDMTPGHHPVPGIYRVTLDTSKNPLADYLRGTFDWHIDGCTPSKDVPPIKASLLTAHAVADKGGETEFASTYAAYDDLDRRREGTARPAPGRARARGVAAAGHARPHARGAGAVAAPARQGAPAGLEAQLRPPFPRARRVDPERRGHEPRRGPEAARRPARARRRRPSVCTATSGKSATR